MASLNCDSLSEAYILRRIVGFGCSVSNFSRIEPALAEWAPPISFWADPQPTLTYFKFNCLSPCQIDCTTAGLLNPRPPLSRRPTFPLAMGFPAALRFQFCMPKFLPVRTVFSGLSVGARLLERQDATGTMKLNPLVRERTKAEQLKIVRLRKPRSPCYGKAFPEQISSAYCERRSRRICAP